MTYVPHGPLWCWNVQGADTVYLSQPTECWHGGRTIRFPVQGPLAARCEFASWLEEYDDSARTYPIQCGHLAVLLPDGRYLCKLHTGKILECDLVCAWCEELKQAGDSRACPGCHATWRENGFPDWCCDPDLRWRRDG